MSLLFAHSPAHVALKTGLVGEASQTPWTAVTFDVVVLVHVVIVQLFHLEALATQTADERCSVEVHIVGMHSQPTAGGKGGITIFTYQKLFPLSLAGCQSLLTVSWKLSGVHR